ncbi:MAG: hypothetical protein ACE5K1_07825 [Acidiferrobacterales bacterium]
MKLRRLGQLFSFRRYNLLKKYFQNPLRALMASSGIFKRPQKLITRNNQVIAVNRGDLPLWEEYFTSRTCTVFPEGSLFRVVPNDSRFAPYHIKGNCQCFTFEPQRWNKNASRAPLVRELELAEKSVYSQHGEDGVIEALLRHIPATYDYIVEFGAYDGITMSNSRYLIEDKGWSAFLIELDSRFYKRLASLYAENEKVTTLRAAVTPTNINRLFKQAEVPKDFDILSIDIDGPDYYVWQGLTEYRPKIVIIEYNSSIAPEREYVVPAQEAFARGGTDREGASFLSLYQLGKSKGYRLVYSELSGANLFFVHHSCAVSAEFTEVEPSLLYQPPHYGLLSGGTAPNGRGYPPSKSFT